MAVGVRAAITVGLRGRDTDAVIGRDGVVVFPVTVGDAVPLAPRRVGDAAIEAVGETDAPCRDAVRVFEAAGDAVRDAVRTLVVVSAVVLVISLVAVDVPRITRTA
jgi:hypothetical protein